MRYFKIQINEEGASDSMTFAAETEKNAWAQLDELTGGIPRSLCDIKVITEEEYFENNPPEEESTVVDMDELGLFKAEETE